MAASIDRVAGQVEDARTNGGEREGRDDREVGDDREWEIASM